MVATSPPPPRRQGEAAPTELQGRGGADGRPRGPGGGRGPRVCPRVAACARARTSLCGEAARRCLRVPGACARGCLAPCLCRCLGVSREGACARRARAPGLGRAVSGADIAGCWAGGCFSLGGRGAGYREESVWSPLPGGEVQSGSIFSPWYPVKHGRLSVLIQQIGA